jgi:hypothetical protein
MKDPVTQIARKRRKEFEYFAYSAMLAPGLSHTHSKNDNVTMNKSKIKLNTDLFCIVFQSVQGAIQVKS